MWKLLKDYTDFNNKVNNIITFNKKTIQVGLRVALMAWGFFSILICLFNVLPSLFDGATVNDILFDIALSVMIAAFPVCVLYLFFILITNSFNKFFEQRWKNNQNVYYIKGIIKQKIHKSRRSSSNSYYIIQVEDVEYKVSCVYSIDNSIPKEGDEVIIFVDGAENVNNFIKESEVYFCCLLDNISSTQYE